MHIIHIDQVQVPEDRQRTEIDAEALAELAKSIDTPKGLIHPIVIREVEGVPTLVVGERRLRAMKSLANQGKQIRFQGEALPLSHIPTLLFSELSELDAIEAELDENLHRVNLTWQEEVAAKKKLHDLRVLLNPNQTFHDTARELNDTPVSEGGRRSRVQELKKDYTLAEALATNPAFAKVKTKKEALKLIDRKNTDSLLARLAEKSKTTPDQGISSHTLLLGSCTEILQRPEFKEKFDVIITDPPYGIDADNFGEQASFEHEYQDSEDEFKALMADFASISYSVAAEQAHMYVFFDIRHISFLTERLQSAGWSVWHAPIIWSKGNGMLPAPEYAPRRTYECILFCNKGKLPVTRVASDVINIPPVSVKRHGAEKPTALYEELLSRSCRPGYKVLDAFAGSGTIFPAANRLNLVATGINLSEPHYNLAHSRLLEDKK